MRTNLVIRSPAKVNLILRILSRRENGYHEIRTVFQKISLYDRLRFSLTSGSVISISTNHPSLPRDEGNVVYKAALAIRNRCRFPRGVEIEIQKRIPIGGGLGGGSSNAAMTLIALNKLLELGLSRKTLMEMGLQIGADVPFFLMDGAALGSGIGEKLKSIKLPDLWFVLISPNFQVSTAWAYRNFMLTKRRIHYNIQRFPRTAKGISRRLWNDLEETTSREHPEVIVMKNCLLSAGAQGALMTGSGPTVFGLFAGGEDASKAYRRVRQMVRERGWTVFLAHSIDA